jgi:hypothetical protein
LERHVRHTNDNLLPFGFPTVERKRSLPGFDGGSVTVGVGGNELA